MSSSIFQFLFVLWLALSIIIGIIATRRTKELEDYLVAGRNIGPFLYGISMIATALTPAVFVGFAGQLYAFGNSIVYWMILPLGIAFSLSLCVFAPKIRRFGKFTVPDYLASRYDSNVVRVIAAIIIAIFGILYAVQITMGTSVIVSTLFGWSWALSCIVVTAVCFVFTYLSGLVGIIWNSVQFTLVFVLGTLAVAPFVLSKAGSLSTIATNIEANFPGFFSLFGHNPLAVTLPVALSWALIMLTGNSIFNPAALSRHYVVRSEKVPVRASLIAGLAMVAVYIPCFLTFYGGISLYPTLKDPESLYIVLSMKDAPVWAGSIALFGIVASGLSTIGVDYMLTSTSLVNDIYVNIFHRDAPKNKQLTLTRVGIIIAAVIALLISIPRPTMVIQMLLIAASFSLVFAAPITLGIWWKRATKEGAIAGMVAGLIGIVITQVWKMLAPKTFNHWFEPAIVGLILSVGLFVIVSLLTKPTPKQIEVYEQLRTKSREELKTER